MGLSGLLHLFEGTRRWSCPIAQVKATAVCPDLEEHISKRPAYERRHRGAQAAYCVVISDHDIQWWRKGRLYSVNARG